MDAYLDAGQFPALAKKLPVPKNYFPVNSRRELRQLRCARIAIAEFTQVGMEKSLMLN